MLCHNAPKSNRFGHKPLVPSTAFSVLSFNEGSLSYSVLNGLGLTARFEALQYILRHDQLRNKSRHRRMQIEAYTKLAKSSRKRRDKSVYASEMLISEIHSSCEESDVLCNTCQLRDCPIPSARKFEQWVLPV